MVRNFSTSFMMFLLAIDFVSAMIAVRLAEYLRTTVSVGRVAPSYSTPLAFYILVPLIWTLLLNANAAYSPRGTYRAVVEVYNLIRATMISILIISGFLYLVFRDYSRVQAAYLVALMGLLTIAARGMVRLYFKLTGGRKYDSRHIVIVGTTKLAQLVGRQVRSYAWTGLYLVGYLTSEESPDTAEVDGEPLKIVGDITDLEQLVDEHNIDEVIFAIRRPTYSTLSALVHKMYQKDVNVRLAPDVQDFAYLNVTIEEISGLPLISLREPVLTPSERIFKRIFDISVSLILFILFLPLMALIAIVVRLDSPGAPIFVQKRVGENRRVFKMYKFRTMVADAELLQDEIIEYDANGQIIHKKVDDPRVTRVGRFLRRTSLDELPQIVNILKGDMSLVGPRPEMPWMVEKYESWQLKRFEVPQGLTGWWQINGRSETPMHLSTEDDLYYILNYSIALDLLILLRTPSVVLSRRGAF